MDKLIVAVVSWNTLDLTRQCLKTAGEELARLQVLNEIWVVDNASSDSSVEMIRQEFPAVALIVNRENVGFARANNQILSQAQGSHYLLLNSDTVIRPGSFKTMLAFMAAHPEAAAVSPRLIYPDGRIQKSFTVLPTVAGELRYCMVLHFFPFGGLAKRLLGWERTDLAAIAEPREAEVLSAACLLLRREVIDKVGLLGEGYFLFSEENDYFYRMRRAGLKGYYLPAAEITHLVGASRKKSGEAGSAVNFLRSRMIYFGRFHPDRVGAVRFIYRLFFAWSLAMARLTYLIKGRRDDHYVNLYRSLTQALAEVKP